ncbi:unnamed protein product, partial [Urochloa humidicola]
MTNYLGIYLLPAILAPVSRAKVCKCVINAYINFKILKKLFPKVKLRLLFLWLPIVQEIALVRGFGMVITVIELVLLSYLMGIAIKN